MLRQDALVGLAVYTAVVENAGFLGIFIFLTPIDHGRRKGMAHDHTVSTWRQLGSKALAKKISAFALFLASSPFKLHGKRVASDRRYVNRSFT